MRQKLIDRLLQSIGTTVERLCSCGVRRQSCHELSQCRVRLSETIKYLGRPRVAPNLNGCLSPYHTIILIPVENSPGETFGPFFTPWLPWCTFTLVPYSTGFWLYVSRLPQGITAYPLFRSRVGYSQGTCPFARGDRVQTRGKTISVKRQPLLPWRQPGLFKKCTFLFFSKKRKKVTILDQ